jgi:hypothetical protein
MKLTNAWNMAKFLKPYFEYHYNIFDGVAWPSF